MRKVAPPLRLDVLQGVRDLNVRRDDVPVGLRAPWILTAVPQLPEQSVEVLPARPVHEKHEQQAAAAAEVQYVLSHAHKRQPAVAQDLLLRWPDQHHAVEELAEEHQQGHRQVNGPFLGTGEEAALCFPLPHQAAYQKSKLERVGNQDGQEESRGRVGNGHFMVVTLRGALQVSVGASEPHQQQGNHRGSQDHQGGAHPGFPQQGVGRRVQSQGVSHQRQDQQAAQGGRVDGEVESSAAQDGGLQVVGPVNQHVHWEEQEQQLEAAEGGEQAVKPRQPALSPIGLHEAVEQEAARHQTQRRKDAVDVVGPGGDVIGPNLLLCLGGGGRGWGVWQPRCGCEVALADGAAEGRRRARLARGGHTVVPLWKRGKTANDDEPVVSGISHQFVSPQLRMNKKINKILSTLLTSLFLWKMWKTVNLSFSSAF